MFRTKQVLPTASGADDDSTMVACVLGTVLLQLVGERDGKPDSLREPPFILRPGNLDRPEATQVLGEKLNVQQDHAARGNSAHGT